jgi:tRNA(fMet)-specific endonuclease VapC
MALLIDTDVCIAAMKKDPKVLSRLQGLELGEVGLPAIVLGELSFGAEKSQNPVVTLRKLGAFVQQFSIIGFDFRAAHHYGRIKAGLERAGTPIGGNDYLIAATALAHDSVLLTRNVREFSRVPGLRWETI